MSRHKTNAGIHHEAEENPVMEYASRPVFWWLALFIVASFFVTIGAAHRRGRGQTTPATGPPPPLPTSPKEVPRAALQRPEALYTRWLAPYYRRSLLRRAMAVALYLGVLALQLRHGVWVLATWRRLLAEMLQQWPTDIGTVFWVQCVYALSVLVLAGVGLGLAAFGGAVLLLQVQCLLELTLSD